MKKRIAGLTVILICLFKPPLVLAQDSVRVEGPITYVYATIDSIALKAYVFRPAKSQERVQRSAIAIFHGGGWTIGKAEWAFDHARHFASLGMVAVAVQYRLSDQKSITPLEAMADARAVIRWIRSSANLLGINPDRVAAYGWSAGAHLAVCAAIFDDTLSVNRISAAPNALVLVSPALSLGPKDWPARLLGTRADISEISPDKHVKKGLPPTLILQGSEDTVTPLPGVKKFYELMLNAGNRCDLQVYQKVGHLFTPMGIRDDEWPQPDLKIQAKASGKTDEFLISLGYVK